MGGEMVGGGSYLKILLLGSSPENNCCFNIVFFQTRPDLLPLPFWNFGGTYKKIHTYGTYEALLIGSNSPYI